MDDLLLDDSLDGRYEDYKDLRHHAYLILDASYIPTWNLEIGGDYYSNTMEEMFDFSDVDKRLTYSGAPMKDKLIYTLREDLLEDSLKYLRQNNVIFDFFEPLARNYLLTFSTNGLSVLPKTLHLAPLRSLKVNMEESISSPSHGNCCPVMSFNV